MPREINIQTGKIGYVPMTIALLAAGTALSVGTCNDNKVDFDDNDLTSKVEIDNTPQEQRSITAVVESYKLQLDEHLIEGDLPQERTEQTEPNPKYVGDYFYEQISNACGSGKDMGKIVQDLFFKVNTGQGISEDLDYKINRPAMLLYDILPAILPSKTVECSPEQKKELDESFRHFFDQMPEEVRAGALNIFYGKSNMRQGKEEELRKQINESKDTGDYTLVDQFVDDILLAHKYLNPNSTSETLSYGGGDPLDFLLSIRSDDIQKRGSEGNNYYDWSDSYIADRMSQIALDVFYGENTDICLPADKMLLMLKPQKMEEVLEWAYDHGNMGLFDEFNKNGSQLWRMTSDQKEVYDEFMTKTCPYNHDLSGCDRFN